MSQALQNQVKRLESRVADLEEALRVLMDAMKEQYKRKPGRPRTNDVQR